MILIAFWYNILGQAGELRKDLTKAEKKLWLKLRKKQLMGYKFRRQHAINQFVADFYCHNAKLVILLAPSPTRWLRRLLRNSPNGEGA